MVDISLAGYIFTHLRLMKIRCLLMKYLAISHSDSCDTQIWPFTCAGYRRFLGVICEKEVMLLLDTSSSMAMHLPEIKEAMTSLFSNMPTKIRRLVHGTKKGGDKGRRVAPSDCQPPTVFQLFCSDVILDTTAELCILFYTVHTVYNR